MGTGVDPAKEYWAVTESGSEQDIGLHLRGITKTFGTLVANDHIDLDIVPGRIHCLLGENGAGKTTLMNVLYGLLSADSGTIYIDGVPQIFKNSRDAIDAGIGMVHQHFMLIEVFSVAENIVLGREPVVVPQIKFHFQPSKRQRPSDPAVKLQAAANKFLDGVNAVLGFVFRRMLGFLSMITARRQVKSLSTRYQLNVDPNAIIEDLPVGVRQRVEILKALANNAKYLVFDEPTAVLTPQETDELMNIMKALRDEGHAIVFITHKLHEVRAIADDITVIRRGRVVGHARPGTSEVELAEMMVGRSVSMTVDRAVAKPGEVALSMRDLRVADATGAVVVNGVSFDVHKSEIVCVAGVQGNGQTELVEALLGRIPLISGSITLGGVDVTRANPRRTIDAGVGYVPEDRQRDGLIATMTIAENLVLDQINDFARFGSLDLRAIDAHARAVVNEFDIRTPDVTLLASSLSGGNQQKAVLARELSRELVVLVASQPTRGVDVGAIEFLHKRIVAERDKGTAVLIVSTELDEVEDLSDRTIVMFRGRVVGEAPPGTARDVLGLMMAGMDADQAQAAVAADVLRRNQEGTGDE